MNYEITFTEDPADADLQVLQDGLEAFTEAQIGEEDRREIAFFMKDGQGCVIGGVQGGYGNYGWVRFGSQRSIGEKGMALN